MTCAGSHGWTVQMKVPWHWEVNMFLTYSSTCYGTERNRSRSATYSSLICPDGETCQETPRNTLTFLIASKAIITSSICCGDGHTLMLLSLLLRGSICLYFQYWHCATKSQCHGVSNPAAAEELSGRFSHQTCSFWHFALTTLGNHCLHCCIVPVFDSSVCRWCWPFSPIQLWTPACLWSARKGHVWNVFFTFFVSFPVVY